jgi:hypothetical protein
VPIRCEVYSRYSLIQLRKRRNTHFQNP